MSRWWAKELRKEFFKRRIPISSEPYLIKGRQVFARVGRRLYQVAKIAAAGAGEYPLINNP